MALQRQDIRLLADPKRVLLQFFFPGSLARASKIISRIATQGKTDSVEQLNAVLQSYSSRHKNIRRKFLEHYDIISSRMTSAGKEFLEAASTLKSADEETRLLIGAYFSKEYSIEAAALFNPSIVQTKDNRFVISLRGAGEGHISSIEFREAGYAGEGRLRLLDQTRLISTGETIADKDDPLSYTVTFDHDTDISERVLFPVSADESNGMEDARFVRFNSGDDPLFYGTYTAYNGREIAVKLIETKDFRTFRISRLNGSAVMDKGMALFPEKVNGLYTIISRQDGENLFIMQSEDIREWNEMSLLRAPEEPWEFVQIGNCGSPLKTPKGWILLTHGVGPVRKYVISAILLDLNDPSKIAGTLNEPLISPDETEREGYVPNVVYTCGAVIHEGRLIIPYAMSDAATGVASVHVDELLGKFRMKI